MKHYLKILFGLLVPLLLLSTLNVRSQELPDGKLCAEIKTKLLNEDLFSELLLQNELLKLNNSNQFLVSVLNSNSILNVTNNTENKSDLNYSILTNLGQQIKNGVLNADRTQIDISDYSPGTYNLIVFDIMKKNNQTFKFAVVK